MKEKLPSVSSSKLSAGSLYEKGVLLMRFLVKALSALVLCGISLLAKADTLNFSLTGEGNSYTFSLPSNPVPNAAGPDTYFVLTNVTVTVNSQSNDTANLTFFSSSSGSPGLDIFPLSPSSLDLDGPQLYTGSEEAPVFAPGTFSLGNSATEKPYSLVISDAGPPSVPEPSTLLLLGTGSVSAVGVVRRKVATHASRL
jgi:hypothetical protein